MLTLAGDRERRGIRRRTVVRVIATLVGAGLLFTLFLSNVTVSSPGGYYFWNWLSEGESGSATLRNVGLFVVALIGLPFAMWRTVVAARQIDIAQRALRNDKHQKAVEMFGHSALTVRVGGIYALQHLAKEYPTQYHVQVMRLFCAFLSHSTGLKTTDHIEDEAGRDAAIDTGDPKTPTDAQIVLRAIGTRDRARIELEERDGFDLVIIESDLSSFRMDDVHSFIYDLRSWRLIDSRPKRRANLSKVHFQNVNLSEANLSFVDISRAEFSNPDLTKAHLEDADLSRTSWDGGTLKGAQLSSADLSKATLRETSLTDCSEPCQLPRRRGQSAICDARSSSGVRWPRACPHVATRMTACVHGRAVSAGRRSRAASAPSPPPRLRRLPTADHASWYFPMLPNRVWNAARLLLGGR